MDEIGRPKGSALPPVALGLIIGAAGWYLLRELAPILRPLLLAVFLCYTIVPAYQRLRASFPGKVAGAVLVLIVGLLMYAVVLVVQDNVVALQEQLPRLTHRAQAVFTQGRTFLTDTLPWLAPSPEEAARLDEQRVGRFRDALTSVFNVGAGVLVDAGVVAVYLLFLVLDASRWPGRLRNAFDKDHGEQLLAIASRINESIVNYFRVKVRTSLILAVGVMLIMFLTGTSFPVLWALINFLGNFIPYLGSIFGFTLPVVFAFLDHDVGWQPIAAAVLMLTLHLVLAYLVEPRMTGKAVGLSPLVILISLAFWGHCWGVTGMFLAVPLTVIVKIVLDNFPYTQPLARMLGDE